MVILTVETKEFTGIGPANGYPVDHLAFVFKTEECARDFLKNAPGYGKIKTARIYGGYGNETSVIDMSNYQITTD